jgi:sphingomyelin phosphodiesterase
VDPVTFGVLDYTVYYTNISSPTYQSAGPTWSALYSAKELYGSALGIKDPAAELTPGFWHNLTALFESDDSLFQTYNGLKSRNYDLSTCTGSCKTGEICQLRAAQAQFNCGTVQPGVHFKRDVAHTPSGTSAVAGECDGSQSIPILSIIPGDVGIKSLTKAMISVLGNSILNMTVPTNYMVPGYVY